VNRSSVFRVGRTRLSAAFDSLIAMLSVICAPPYSISTEDQLQRRRTRVSALHDLCVLDTPGQSRLRVPNVRTLLHAVRSYRGDRDCDLDRDSSTPVKSVVDIPAHSQKARMNGAPGE